MRPAFLPPGAAIDNGEGCIQVHGGIGFTAESNAHVFLKRAQTLARIGKSVRRHPEGHAWPSPAWCRGARMSVDGMTGAPAWHAVAADLRARWAVERAAQREAWRRDGLLTDKTLHEHVLAGRDRYGDATLTFHRLESSVTYSLAALYDEATRVADGLAALGLKAGDVILVQSPSWQEAMLSFLAALRLGLVTTPVVHIYGPSEIGQIASRSGAKALILPQNWRGTPLEDRLEAQGPMPGVRHVVSIGGGDSTGHVRSWESLSSAGHPDAPVATGNATDVCALLYTSGTTSRPKGVLHTHESIAAEVLSNTRYLPSNERPGFLNALLAGHVGGLLAMMRPWFYGFNSVFMEKWDNAVAADLVRTHGLEWSNGTPFHLNGLLDAGLSDQNCRLQSYVGRCGVSCADAGAEKLVCRDRGGAQLWQHRAPDNLDLCSDRPA